MSDTLIERVREHVRRYRRGEVDDVGTRLLVELFAAVSDDLKATGHALSDAANMYKAEAERQKRRADALLQGLHDTLERTAE